jgi:hypothetical protein
MKLARNTEWAIIGGLILYLAFTPGDQAIKDLLATPIGKAAALAGIVYVWKYVSTTIAVLLIVAFLRCAKWNVWEMFSGAELTCTCENPDATWDSVGKVCKDSSGTSSPVMSCTCANGYAWDGGEKGKKECVPVSGEQPPVPIPSEPNPIASALEPPTAAAPATAGAAAPSAVPMTTPGAAQEAAAAATPPPAEGGVQPGSGTASVPAAA